MESMLAYTISRLNWEEVVQMNSAKERLINGIVKENPTFVLMLGMCPTLADTGQRHGKAESHADAVKQ